MPRFPGGAFFCAWFFRSSGGLAVMRGGHWRNALCLLRPSLLPLFLWVEFFADYWG